MVGQKKFSGNVDPSHGPEADLETRRRVFEAARELFTLKGFKGVSMRDVAEAVKVTPAALYYHFPQGKEELFVGVVRQIFEDKAEATRQAVAAGKDSREKLYLLAVQILSGLWRDSGWPMLMRDVHEYLSKDLQPEIWKCYGMTYVRAIRDIFQEGVDNGEISASVSPEVLANMFHSMNMSFGWSPRFREGLADTVEAERAASTLVSVLFDGIALKRP